MAETAKPPAAVIGLGSMGFGMATSLKRAGFEVTGCDVSDDTVSRFVKDGGKGAKAPAEAARDAGIVVSVVVNAAQTETILFGKDGVAETLPKRETTLKKGAGHERNKNPRRHLPLWPLAVRAWPHAGVFREYFRQAR